MVTQPASDGKSGTDVSVNTATGEITETKRPFSDDELRSITSLDSIKALLGDKVAQATDLGSGFALLDSDQKRRLIGVPTLFLFWSFNTEGKQGEFVSAHVVTLDGSGQVNGKFIINDGSTGILAQLKEWSGRTGENKGLFAVRGLRASDYTIVGDDGKDKAATTFYIDTTPAA